MISMEEVERRLLGLEAAYNALRYAGAGVSAAPGLNRLGQDTEIGGGLVVTGGLGISGVLAANGGLTVVGNVAVGAGTLAGQALSLGDDAAASFTPGKIMGFLFVHDRTAPASRWGIVVYRTGEAPAIAKAAGVAAFAVTTGALVGTTGVDGNITVSVHTDGKIYVENRAGGAVSLGVETVGA